MKNYTLKTILRHLWRNRLFTSLNIFGLAIGISACWLVFGMVNYEYSYDQQIPEVDQVYQIVTQNEFEGQNHGFPGVTLGLSPFLEIQSVDDVLIVPMYRQYFERLIVTKPDGKETVSLEDQGDLVGTRSSYFDLISYSWIAGNAKTAFNNPNNMVLTKEKAALLFPGEDLSGIVGRVIMADTTAYAVSGVLDDLPYPSSFKDKIFIPIPDREWGSENWEMLNSAHLLFVKTDNPTALDHLLKLGQQRYDAISGADDKKMGYKTSFAHFPVKEKHFEQQYDTTGTYTDKKVMYGLIAIGGFLLILACINYINLSTAQVPQRAKEIGIRKTLGARPAVLTLNFLMETFCICLLSLLLSWPMVIAFQRAYPEFMPPGIENFSAPWTILLFLVGLVILITVLAGIYPSYLINKLRSIETLKGKLETRIQGTRFTLRKTLIVFQFVIAQFFIVGALIMAYQLNFTLSKDLGFTHDAVVTVRMPWKSYENADVNPFLYKEALQKHPEVSAVALGHEPQNQNHWGNSYDFIADTGRVQFTSSQKFIDDDFLRLYDIELAAGRNIQQTDTMRDALINETAVQALGLTSPAEAIGKVLITKNNIHYPIVGVFKDFHQKSLRNKMEPLIFYSSNESGKLQTFHIKLPEDRTRWAKTFAIMETEWKMLYPNAPFEYTFVDQTIKNLYEKEHRTAKLIDLATAVTILVSCLGLFGLATMTAFQRNKEIGIRKVLGASVSGIVAMLSKDFVKVVLIAILIASPLAWWAMNTWLADFAYRIEIQWWMFALAGMLALTVALLTVSGQAIRAALTHPVDSLRDE